MICFQKFVTLWTGSKPSFREELRDLVAPPFRVCIKGAKLRISLLLVGFVAVLTLANRADAQTYYRWRTPGDGGFAVAGNWQQWNGSSWVAASNYPQTSDIVYFYGTNSPGSAPTPGTITTLANRTVNTIELFESGGLAASVNWDMSGNTLTASNYVRADSAYMSMTNGSYNFGALYSGVDSYGNYAHSGRFDATNGSTVSVAGETFLASRGFLYVTSGGNYTTASLRVADNSGFGSYSPGVNVDGSASRLTVTGTTDLGDNVTNGVHTVSNGGRVSSGGVLIDGGSLTITGSGSQWNAGELQINNRIGYTGLGVAHPIVIVSAGGLLTATGIDISEQTTNDVGTLIVTGPGSKIVTGGGIKLGLSSIGPSSSGVLKVLDQGVFNATSSTSGIDLKYQLDPPSVGPYSNYLILNNGVVGAATINVGSGAYVQGYGVLIGTQNIQSGALFQIASPSGTVYLSVDFDIGSRPAVIYSSGQPTLNGTVTIAGGSLTSANEINLGASGRLNGRGTISGGTELVSGSQINVSGGTLNTGYITGTAGAISVASGSTLSVNDAGVNSGFLGTISGAGDLVKTGTGIFTLGGSAANTNSGTTTVSGGRLELAKTAGVNALGGDLTITGGTVKYLAHNLLPNTTTVTINSGTVQLNGFSDTIGGLQGTGGTLNLDTTFGLGITQVSIGTLTYSGTIIGTGGIGKDGNGTLVLAGSGANTNSGSSNVSGGTLEFAKTAGVNALGGKLLVLGGVARHAANDQLPDFVAVQVDGGQWDLNSRSEVVSEFSGSGGSLNISNGGQLIDSQTSTTNYNGKITGNGGIFWKGGGGTLQLGGSVSNDFLGITKISGGTLEFNKTGGAVAASGSILMTGGIIKFLAANQTGIIPIAIEDGVFDTNGFAASIGTLSGANGTLQMGNSPLTVTQAANASFNGVLTGAGTFTKQGAATLTLGGTTANTNTGMTTVAAGTLELGKTASLNAIGGDLTVSGGTVKYLAHNLLPNSTTVTINGGTVQFNGFSDTIGGLQGTGGTLNLDTGFGLGITQVSAGTLTYSGTIIGTGGIGKDGNGTLVLAGTGANTFNGTSNVSSGILALAKSSNVDAIASDFLVLGGTLRLDAIGQIKDTASITVSSGTFQMAANSSENIKSLSGTGGTVQFDSNSALGIAESGSAVFSGVMAGVSTGGFVKGGPGTLTLSGAAANTLAGNMYARVGTLAFNKSPTNGGFAGNTLFVDGGIARLDANNQIGDSTTLAMEGGTFDVNGKTETIGSLAINGSGGGTVNINGGQLTVNQSLTRNFNGVIAGSTGTFILGGGPSVLTLNGAASNTFTGITRIATGNMFLAKTGGAIAIAGNVEVAGGQLFAGTGGQSEQIANTSTVTITGGIFNNDQIETIGGLSGSGGILGNTGILNVVQNTDSTFSGALMGGISSAQFHKMGGAKLTLAGNGSGYTGTTYIDAGHLAVTGSLGGPVQVASGAKLSGTGTILGTTTLGAGSTLAAGASVGTLTIDNSLNFAGGPSSTWEIEINGLATNNADRLSLTGASSTLDFLVTPASKIILSLVNLGAPFPAWEPREYTIAQVATAGNIRVNGTAFVYDQTHWDFAFTGFAPAGDRYLYVSGNSLMLHFQPVPEPAQMLLAIGGIAAAVWGFRRRSLWQRV